MAINSVSQGVSFSPFGSYESVKRQAEEIKKRVRAQTEAREAEQEKTGLIKDPSSGKMVEMSSLTEDQIKEWNRRNELNTVSIRDAYVLFSAADPHAEEIEENKKLAAKYEKIQSKMLAGQKLKSEEKKFLRENYPELASKAEQMEEEAESLKQKLRGKSSDEARQIYLQAKLNVASQLDSKDGSALFLMAALDSAYAEHTGQKNPRMLSVDISA